VTAMLPTTFDRLQELSPGPAAELARLNAAAWEATDPRLLELCRRRLKAMLGDCSRAGEDAARARELGLDPRKLEALERWAGSDEFTAAERAHLAFTEQFVTSVSAVSDEHVEDLLRHGDMRSVYDFVSALYVVELTERLDLVARATFARGEGTR
jgi:alkylhydroperoxidase family enzyme